MFKPWPKQGFPGLPDFSQKSMTPPSTGGLLGKLQAAIRGKTATPARHAQLHVVKPAQREPATIRRPRAGQLASGINRRTPFKRARGMRGISCLGCPSAGPGCQSCPLGQDDGEDLATFGLPAELSPLTQPPTPGPVVSSGYEPALPTDVSQIESGTTYSSGSIPSTGTSLISAPIASNPLLATPTTITSGGVPSLASAAAPSSSLSAYLPWILLGGGALLVVAVVKRR